MQLSALIRLKRDTLGVSEKAQLQRLKDNEFLPVKLNAWAVKTQLHNRLHQRKFELERLEHSYRQTLSSMSRYLPIHPVYGLFSLDKKLSTQTEGSVNCRKQGILQLAKSYNDLCEKLCMLSKASRAP